MTGAVLVLNAGSSSLKVAVYGADGGKRRAAATVSGLGQGRPQVAVKGDCAPLPEPPRLPVTDLTVWLLELLSLRTGSIAAVGHRIVHGGRHFDTPVVLDDAAMAALEDLVPLAPLHEPHNLNGVIAAREIWPGAMQVGCFDTAFHRTQPELAQRFALPREMHDDGLVRYGFHGLSYQHIAEVLPDHLGAAAKGRVIVAHLGNGASMCAMRNRRSIATTMGMTALDGLMMGTRSGAIDPGLVLHLIEARGMSPAEAGDLLYHRSGLLGVSGISADLRVLEASADPAAEEAQALFALRAQQAIGGLAAVLGGLDALVFTGGIGQNSAAMRARICDGMNWIGIDLDQSLNRAGGPVLHRQTARVPILALPTDEESVIARATNALLAARTENAR